MANLLDYLDWRGDMMLSESPFNEVDNLILAELSYADFTGIVPPLDYGAGIPLRKAVEMYFEQCTDEKEISMGVLVPEEIPQLLRKMADSRRFADMKLNCFTEVHNTERAEQFAAITVETENRRLYLSFRGTDDTLAGWKEDFHMSFMPEVPSQKLAVEYTQAVARQYPRFRLQLGGHSKGGNLAVWSSIFVPATVQRRILSVWSNDGPGFHDIVLQTPQHDKVADRIHCIIPKSSVVGMILEHEEDYTVVDSSQKGLWQHDGFSWKVLGPRFVHLGCVSVQGRIHDRTLEEWIGKMPLGQREKFVDGMFSVLEASGAVTLTDLKTEGLKAAGTMVRAMKDMDKDTREALLYAVKLLFQSNFQALLEELQQETEKRKGIEKEN